MFIRHCSYTVSLSTLLFLLPACSNLNTGIQVAVPERPRTTNAQEDPYPPRVLVIATDRFVLLYPSHFYQWLPLEQVLVTVGKAFERVEAQMGEFDTPVIISLVPSIVPNDPDFPEGLYIAGLCYEAFEQINVVISLPAAFDAETFAHEFLHARLRDLGLNPPRWLEEGMAHYFDTATGFNPSMFELLETQGIMSTDEVTVPSDVDEHEMKRRATGWAMVYYLHKVKGMSLVDILTMSEFPETDVVLAAVNDAAEKFKQSHAQVSSTEEKTD